MLVSWEGLKKKKKERKQHLEICQKFANRDGGSLPQLPEEQTKQKQTTNSLNNLLLKEIDRRAKFSTKPRTERGTFSKKDVEDLSWKNYVMCFFDQHPTMPWPKPPKT